MSIDEGPLRSRGTRVTGKAALRLTLLDLLLIAGTAVASFWAGQGISTNYADRYLGDPLPDITFQIQAGIPSLKDQVSSDEEQQKLLSYQVDVTQTILDYDQIKLTHSSGTTATSLRTNISETSALLVALSHRQNELSDDLDNKNSMIARADYHAQRSATRWSSLRRVHVWAFEAIGSLGVFTGLAILLLVLRFFVPRGLHMLAVICGGLAVLLGLLVTAYAGWIGLMLLVILALALLSIGRKSGNVSA